MKSDKDRNKDRDDDEERKILVPIIVESPCQPGLRIRISSIPFSPGNTEVAPPGRAKVRPVLVLQRKRESARVFESSN